MVEREDDSNQKEGGREREGRGCFLKMRIVHVIDVEFKDGVVVLLGNVNGSIKMALISVV